MVSMSEPIEKVITHTNCGGSVKLTHPVPFCDKCGLSLKAVLKTQGVALPSKQVSKGICNLCNKEIYTALWFDKKKRICHAACVQRSTGCICKIDIHGLPDPYLPTCKQHYMFVKKQNIREDIDGKNNQDVP